MFKTDENLSTVEKFFGYFQDENGNFSHYKDDLVSDPYTDWRQLAWIVLMPIVAYFVYKYFYYHKNKARNTVVALSIFLLVVRIYENVTEVVFGREDILKLFPYHMCGIASFAIPIVVLFNIKKLKLPIYTIGIMGGIITVLIGETFTSEFTTMFAMQSVISHSLLILIPLIEHASGEYKFDIKKSWTMFPIILIFIAWAMIGNRIFFSGQNTNYMYLDKSGLPGDAGGSYYFLIYIVIFLIMYSFFFVPPYIRNKRKADQKLETTEKV